VPSNTLKGVALNPDTAGLIFPEVAARVAEATARLGYRRDLLGGVPAH